MKKLEVVLKKIALVLLAGEEDSTNLFELTGLLGKNVIFWATQPPDETRGGCKTTFSIPVELQKRQFTGAIEFASAWDSLVSAAGPGLNFHRRAEIRLSVANSPEPVDIVYVFHKGREASNRLGSDLLPKGLWLDRGRRMEGCPTCHNHLRINKHTMPSIQGFIEM